MNTDTTGYSIPATWSVLYHALKGSPWEQEDLADALCALTLSHDKAPATEALKYVYDQAQSWTLLADPEDAVLAVLKACSEHYKSIFLTPGQVKEMAQNFAAFYADADEQTVEYLRETYNGIPLEWLTEKARQEVDRAAHRPSEIWVGEDEKLSGLWVFNKPGI
jgi:hypothetical protein